MKTQLSQILIVVGFFTLAIGATLAVSWGVINMTQNDHVFVEKTTEKTVLSDTNAKAVHTFNRSILLLIPKSS